MTFEVSKELSEAYETIHNSRFERFPHCDPKVLHRKGECLVCDLYPEMQALRIIWNVNFTNENDPKKTTCPAEQARPRNIINRWFGNRASQQ